MKKKLAEVISKCCLLAVWPILVLTFLLSVSCIVITCQTCIRGGVSWLNEDCFTTLIMAEAICGFVTGVLCMAIPNTGSLHDDTVKQELPDLSEMLEKAIPSDHGDNLPMVMTKLRKEPLEYQAAFTLSGKKIAEGTLMSPVVCALSSEGWRIVKNSGLWVRLHNHPGIPETPFSVTDLQGFIRLKSCQKDIVVTKNYTYILEKTYEDGEEPDQKKFCDYVENAFSALKPDLRSVLFERYCYVACVRRIAEQFGLKFQIESLKAQRRQVWLKHHKIQLYSAFVGVVLALAFFAGSGTTNSQANQTDNQTTVSEGQAIPAEKLNGQVNRGTVTDF